MFITLAFSKPRLGVWIRFRLRARQNNLEIIMDLFESTASALDSASGSGLSSERCERVRKLHTKLSKQPRCQAIAPAESEAEVVVSKRA